MRKILTFVYCYKLFVELHIEYKVWRTRQIIVNHHAKSNIFSWRPWMQHKKMAAPCKRMASWAVTPILSHFRGTWAKNNGFRRGFSTSFCRGALQTRSVIEKTTSPWNLLAAVCLQRLPAISATFSPIEQQFKEMLQQVNRFFFFNFLYIHKRCSYSFS